MTELGTSVTSVTGLAEVVMNVQDMAASLEFYRDLLGLEVISPPDMRSPVFLRAGAANADLPAMVVLAQMPPRSPTFNPPQRLHHLALAIPAEIFDDTMSALTERGYEVRTGHHPVIPSRTMYVADPDGTEVELIAPA
jgi:catechol-2,3-dioxygenase